MMKFLIIEQPVNNRGDESAHRGFVNRLSESFPDATIQVLFFEKLPIEVDEMRVKRDNVEYINIPVRHKTFAPHRMITLFSMLNMPLLVEQVPLIKKIKKIYKEADYIVCAPGGIDMGGFQNWVHIGLLNLAKRMNKKIIYFARSIGPFPVKTIFNRLFKKKSIELLSYFNYISLRDEKSQQLAKQLGISVVPTIDSAFLYYTPETEPESFKREMGESRYIVLVPNSLAWHHDFKSYTFETFFEFWVKLCNKLLEVYPEFKIAMLPQTTNYGYAASLPDGYKYFCKIRNASANPERIVVLEERFGSNIQQNIVSKAEFLIGARYHSVIFSINQGIPFVSLCYEHKMKGVTNMLNKEDIDIHELFDNSPTSDEKMQKFIDKIIDMTRVITPDEASKERARAIADRGYTSLVEFIKKGQ